MPDPIKMDGQYACRIAPYDPVRVICVDGPGDSPVAFYDANGCIHCADATGHKRASADFDLIPLRRKPVEAWALLDGAGTIKWVSFHANRTEAELMLREYPGARLVRLVEAEDGA